MYNDTKLNYKSCKTVTLQFIKMCRIFIQASIYIIFSMLIKIIFSTIPITLIKKAWGLNKNAKTFLLKKSGMTRSAGKR